MNRQIADDLTATVLNAVETLRPLDAAVVTHRPSPDRWTIKEVVGHLIDSAANNHQRFVRAQLVEFLVFPKYEQNDWVRCQFYNEVAWEDLIELWQRYNFHLAHVMRHVPAEALTTGCVIGDYDTVTLHFLMEDYVVHLKHHLAKISERLNLAGNAQ
jgi:hypothetical protein